MVFEIVTIDGTVERIDGADSYELEGPLTTFFLSNSRVHRLSSPAGRQPAAGESAAEHQHAAEVGASMRAAAPPVQSFAAGRRR